MTTPVKVGDLPDLVGLQDADKFMVVRNKNAGLVEAETVREEMRGPAGRNGWAPILAAENDGARVIQRIVDWAGGAGEKPATGYIGPNGIVATTAAALNVADTFGAAAAGGIAAIEAAVATAADTTVAAAVPVYTTIAAGLAGVADGQRFAVEQTYGKGVYHYRRSGANAVLITMGLLGVNGQRAATIRALRKIPSVVPPMPSTFSVNLWGVNSAEYDGRLVFNERGASAPTLNVLPDPFTLQDEQADTTPARVIGDVTITDPAGGNNAVKLSFTAQTQINTWWRAADADLPTGETWRLGAWFLLVSGGAAFRLGATSTAGEYLGFNADATWTYQTFTITGYDNSVKNYDFGVVSATANSTGVLGVYAGQWYDAWQGSVLPTAAEELAGVAGHAKRASAYRGSITYGADFSIDNRAAIDGIIVHLSTALQTLSECTLGIWMSPTSSPTSTWGTAMAFDYESGTDNGLDALLGIYQTTGLPYINPSLSMMTTKFATNLIGRGFTSFFVTIKSGKIIPYINGVPVYEDATAWTPVSIRRLIMGVYNGLNKRRKLVNLFPGFLDGGCFAAKAATAAEVAQADQHGLATLRLCGANVNRQVAAFGLCDSMTMNAESWIWRAGGDTTIPRPDFFVEAVGGSSLTDWIARKEYLKAQILAADNAGYEEIWLFALAGANEWPEWKDFPAADGSYSYSARWRNRYLGYLAELKAVSPKVKVFAITMLPRAAASGNPYTVNSLQVERERLAWNADLRANYLTMGIDGVLDFASDSLLGAYATSANAVASSADPDGAGPLVPEWSNPTPDVTLFQNGGVHVTQAGGQREHDNFVRPFLIDRMAALVGASTSAVTAQLSPIELASGTTPPDDVVDLTYDSLGRIIETIRADGTREIGSLKASLINDVPAALFAEMARVALAQTRKRGPLRAPFDINVVLGSGQSNSWDGADGYPAINTVAVPGVYMMDAVRPRHFTGTRYLNGLTPAVEVNSMIGVGDNYGETGGVACCKQALKLIALENGSTFNEHGKIFVPISIGRSGSDYTAFDRGGPTGQFELAEAILTQIKALTTTAGSIHYKKTVGIIALILRWGADGYLNNISSASWTSKINTYVGNVDTYLGKAIFDQTAGTIPVGLTQTFAHGSRDYTTNPYGAEVENALCESNPRFSMITTEGPYFMGDLTGTGAASPIHHSARQSAWLGEMEGLWLKRRCIDRETWPNMIPSLVKTAAAQVTLTIPGMDTNAFEIRPAVTGNVPKAMLTAYGFFFYTAAAPSTELVVSRITFSGNTIVFDFAANLPASPKCRYSARTGSPGQGNIRLVPKFAEYADSALISGVQEPLERWLVTFDRAVA